jgi:serine/threonine protein kinase
MSYCLNPHCKQPQNQSTDLICQSCGGNLLLKDRYRTVKFLDAGGMSRAFLAIDQHTPSQRLCVVKQFFPSPRVINDPKAFKKSVELFQRESEQLDKLSDEAIAIPKLYAYLEQEQRFYLVQEFIDGENLYKELERRGAYSEEEVRDILHQLLPILQIIHDRGVIHRDIKPENIMRRQNGELVLIDFGLSKQLTDKVTTRGTTGGTMGYAPMEQVRGGVAFPSTDLYALAATCIHLLTDMPPDLLYDFELNEWCWKDILKARQVDISNQLREILEKMLQTDTRKRYPSSKAILTALSYRDTPSAIAKYQHYTRLLTFYPWLLALGVLTFLSGMGVFYYRESIECFFGRNNQVCPSVDLSPKRYGDIFYFPYDKGADQQGKIAEFNMAILNDNYYWQVASSDEVIKKGDTTPVKVLSLQEELEKAGIVKIMENPSRLITIGLASCEGAPREEEKRAEERAYTIYELAKRIFTVKEYYVLNLGQFRRDTCGKLLPNEVINQRSMIIIGIRKESEGVILEQALYDRMKKLVQYINMSDYSLGSPEKFTLKVKK